MQVINIDGKKTETVEVSDKVFVPKPNQNLIQTIIDWQINNLKPRKAKTQQRNEVTGSTRKIYAQKGTGGARHSSRKAPLFVGGGVAHGPKGAVYKIKKLNKKVIKLGLKHLLSHKKNINSLFIIQDIKIDIKTLIALLTIAATLGGFYYSTQSRINDLEKEITVLKKQIKRVAKQKGKK